MLHVEDLRPDTRLVYEHLRRDPDIGRYRLIGGTAIALQHAHRESEDLDFFWPEIEAGRPVPRLDKKLTGRIIDRLREAGFDAGMTFDQADFDDAENDGVDLLYAQQDWAVGGVKVSFLTSASREKARFFADASTVSDGNLVILSSDALFEVKSRLLTERATTRDMYDIWYYIEHRGRTLEEAFAFALDENPYYTDELLKKRLIPNRPAATDPGFLSRLPDGPRDFGALRAVLEAAVAAYEQREAARLAEGLLKPR